MSCLCLNSILAQWEIIILLGLFGSFQSFVLFGKGPTNSSSLLLAEIQWEILFSLKCLLELLTLRLRNDSKYLSDAESHHLNLRKLVRGTSSHFRDSKSCKLCLKLIK